MTDRPILFSAPMVRALLDGRKTQTRRVLRLPKWSTGDMGDVEIDDDGSPMIICEETGCLAGWNLPYAVGDRLWVKEAWSQEHPDAIQEGRYHQPGQAGIPGPPGVTYRVIYRIDGEPLQVWNCDDWPYRTSQGPRDDVDAKHPEVCSNFARDGKSIYWDNALFMPRWASRLTLIVTDVRVQRLTDIDEIDAMAEGIIRAAPTDEDPAEFMAIEGGDMYSTPVDAYEALWNRINGALAWKANPWIMALTFTVERRNIDTARAA